MPSVAAYRRGLGRMPPVTQGVPTTQGAPIVRRSYRGSGQIRDGAGGREAGCVPVKCAPPGVAAVGRGVGRGLPLGLDALRQHRGLRSPGQLSEGRQLAGDRRLVPLSAHDDGAKAREGG